MHFLKTQLFQKAQFQKVEPNSPSVIHPNQMAKYLEKKKEVGPDVEREREIRRDKHGVEVFGARQLAQSSSGEGQRAAGRAEVRGRVGGLRSENLKCGFRNFSGLFYDISQNQ